MSIGCCLQLRYNALILGNLCISEFFILPSFFDEFIDRSNRIGYFNSRITFLLNYLNGIHFSLQSSLLVGRQILFSINSILLILNLCLQSINSLSIFIIIFTTIQSIIISSERCKCGCISVCISLSNCYISSIQILNSIVCLCYFFLCSILFCSNSLSIVNLLANGIDFGLQQATLYLTKLTIIDTCLQSSNQRLAFSSLGIDHGLHTINLLLIDLIIECFLVALPVLLDSLQRSDVVGQYLRSITTERLQYILQITQNVACVVSLWIGIVLTCLGNSS